MLAESFLCFYTSLLTWLYLAILLLLIFATCAKLLVFYMIKHNYKDRKCAVNENPSVHIESARSKTSNNGPLRNGSAVSIARLYVDSKIVCFYESDYAFKTTWRRPCSCHLVKINRYFFQLGRPVFIIVINTSCSGVCYRRLLTALWHYLEFLPGVYPVTNALTLSIYYYIRPASYSFISLCPVLAPP